jgi:hypothetical protein
VKAKAWVFGLLVAAGVITLLVVSSLNLARYKAEVCVTFQGQTQCRTASGANEDSTLRAATTDSCATLAHGVTEVMACEHSAQVVHWIRRP